MRKKHSKETKQKISNSLKGRKVTWGKKIKWSLTGRKLSLDHRNKMKGRIPWNKGLPSERKGIPWTDEERKAHLKTMIKGDKHKWWKGGVTPINEKIRKSLEYKLWRKAVFERDNYLCIWGGKEHGSDIVADHIKPFSLYPELRFAIDNGRTLCKNCHLLTPTFGSRMLQIIDKYR